MTLDIVTGNQTGEFFKPRRVCLLTKVEKWQWAGEYTYINSLTQTGLPDPGSAHWRRWEDDDGQKLVESEE